MRPARMRASFLLLASMALPLAAGAAALSTTPPDEHAVVGRFTLESDVGGSVWAFQAGGRLIILGPGDLVARGQWTSGPEEREFDASVTIDVTGQQLDILGAVSPDGDRVAMAILASEPADPGAGVPWPAESRLTGERLGMLEEAAPSPRPATDCDRPLWTDHGIVDWDRCDATLTPP